MERDEFHLAMEVQAAGESILATQIAEDIAKTDKVLYVDLELSSKQFQMRYSDTSSGKAHVFPANFTRAEIATISQRMR